MVNLSLINCICLDSVENVVSSKYSEKYKKWEKHFPTLKNIGKNIYILYSDRSYDSYVI